MSPEMLGFQPTAKLAHDFQMEAWAQVINVSLAWI